MSKNRLKAFGYVFKNSATSPKYYKDVIKAHTSFSIMYFLSLTAVISFVSALFITIYSSGKLTKGAKSFVNNISQSYPQDLVVTAKDGKLSINQTEPFRIPFPPASLPPEASKEGIDNVIVFDSNGTLDDLEKFRTFILVNSSNILVRDVNSKKIEVYPMKNLPNGDFTKADVNLVTGRLYSVIPYIPVLFFPFVSIGLFVSNFIFRLFSSLFVAFVLWFVAKLKGADWNLGASYRTALHAITIPFIIQTVSTAFNYSLRISFWFFTVQVIFGLIALAVVENTKDLTSANSQVL